MTDDDCYWAWRRPATGRTPAFDQERARLAAADDDPNPKGSVFAWRPTASGLMGVNGDDT